MPYPFATNLALYLSIVPSVYFEYPFATMAVLSLGRRCNIPYFSYNRNSIA